MIRGLEEKVLSGFQIPQSEAYSLSSVKTTNAELLRLFTAASRVREHFRGKRIDLCSIVNAKSGACSEDCSYCAQSAKSKAEIPVYALVSEERVIEKALEAKEAGVRRFCIVTSGKKAGKKELKAIAAMIAKVRQIGLLPCATLGLLDRDELSLLRASGLERYHHNLETSERFFPEICSTHSYSDKMRTVEAVKSVGLSLCSGGIFGLGESWQDRVDMAFALRDLEVDSVPINFLIAVEGTPMARKEPLHSLEALKIISLYRLVLPEKEVRVCGGRRQTLGDFSPMVFMAGADSILTGNYLTTMGVTYVDDIRLIKTCGLEVG